MKHIQKIFVVTTALFATVAAYGQEAAQASGGHNGMIALASGIAIAIGVFGGTSAQGNAAAKALEGISRNPAATDKMFVPLILSLALIESLVILSFIIAFLTIPGLK